MDQLELACQAILLEDAQPNRHVRLPFYNTLHANICLVQEQTQALLLLQLNLVLIFRSHTLVLKTLVLTIEAFDKFAFESESLIIVANLADGD